MLRFNNEQMIYVRNQRAQFNNAQRVLHGNAAGLPSDFWKQIDMNVGMVQRDILAVFNDLAASVTRPVPIGPISHEFVVASDSGQSHISLDGISDGLEDRVEYGHFATPLPIVSNPFSYGWRAAEGARAKGFSLDMAPRDNSLRRTAEDLEDLALNGSSKIVVGGNQLYGLRNEPNRNTRSTGVTLNGATGAQWHTEITATLKKLHDANFRVPATIYLNWDDWFYASNTDYSAQYPNKTILQRIKEIEGVESVVPASKVPASEILAVVKRTDVVQVLSAMPSAVIPKFRANQHDDYKFVGMAAAAVQIRHDFNDQCGIAHSAP